MSKTMNENTPSPAADVMAQTPPEEKPIDSILDKMGSGYIALGSAEDMRLKLAETEEKKKIIFEWIENNFVAGTDFGKTDDRSDKDNLMKAGAEKIVRAFNTRAEFHPDWDTWKMLGKPQNIVCYKCLIVDNATNKVIGEGRGAETLGNKGRDANKTIKNAEKCSLVDSALYTFMLSEKFTQDGGKNKTVLADLKSAILADVTVERAGVDSELTDLLFLKKIMDSEIHKNRVTTIGEAAHLRKQLFEKRLYDFSTGEKVVKNA